MGKKTFTTHNTLDWHQSLSGKAVVVVGDGVVISEFVVVGPARSTIFVFFSKPRGFFFSLLSNGSSRFEASKLNIIV